MVASDLLRSKDSSIGMKTHQNQGPARRSQLVRIVAFEYRFDEKRPTRTCGNPDFAVHLCAADPTILDVSSLTLTGNASAEKCREVEGAGESASFREGNSRELGRFGYCDSERKFQIWKFSARAVECPPGPPSGKDSYRLV